MKRWIGIRLGLIGLGTLLSGFVLLSSCGNQCSSYTGYGSSNGLGCGGGAPIPPQTALLIEGTPGTPFSAVISDSVASYNFSGVVPLSVAYVNNTPPVELIAVNKSRASAVLSIAVVSGGIIKTLATTSTPGGTVVTSIPNSAGKDLAAISPPPSCDVRFYVNGPAGDSYQSLLENGNNGYENTTGAPALFLLGGASGDISGVFSRITFTTKQQMAVDLLINGKLITSRTGNNVQIRSGCP